MYQVTVTGAQRWAAVLAIEFTTAMLVGDLQRALTVLDELQAQRRGAGPELALLGAMLIGDPNDDDNVTIGEELRRAIANGETAEAVEQDTFDQYVREHSGQAGVPKWFQEALAGSEAAERQIHPY